MDIWQCVSSHCAKGGPSRGMILDPESKTFSRRFSCEKQAFSEVGDEKIMESVSVVFTDISILETVLEQKGLFLIVRIGVWIYDHVICAFFFLFSEASKKIDNLALGWLYYGHIRQIKDYICWYSSLSSEHLQDLFQTHLAEHEFDESVVLDSNHTVSDGLDFELSLGGVRENHLLDPFGHLQDFEKSRPPLVTFVTTFLATALKSTIEHELIGIAHVFPDAREDFLLDTIVGLVADLTVRTELASEALGYDEPQAGSDEQGIDSEIRETLQGIDTGICMDGREYKVSSDRSLDSQARGFRVPYLSNHDDIRILTKQAPEPVGEVEPDLRIYLRMIHSFDPVLDRILQCGDVFFLWIKPRKHGVKRRGLPGSGRTNDKDQPELVFEMLFQLHHVHRKDAYGAKIHKFALFPEKPDNHFFPVNGGDNTDAQIHILLACDIMIACLSILRESLFVDLESCKDLDLGDEGCFFLTGESSVSNEVSIDPNPYQQSILLGFYVYVRGPERERLCEDAVELYACRIRREGRPRLICRVFGGGGGCTLHQEIILFIHSPQCVRDFCE